MRKRYRVKMSTRLRGMIEVALGEELNVSKVAKILGVSRTHLSRLLNGHTDLTPLMALRIEKAFGYGALGLMIKQSEFQLEDIVNDRT